MEIIVLIIWCVFAGGIFMGSGITMLGRFLKRWGAMQTLQVNPQNGRFKESWDRPNGSLLGIGSKKSLKAVPLGLGRIWSHERTGRTMAIIDSHAGLLVDVETPEGADLEKARTVAFDSMASRAVYPNGEHVSAVINSTSERKFTEEAPMNIGTLAIVVVIGFLAVLGILGFIVTKLLDVAAATGVHHA